MEELAVVMEGGGGGWWWWEFGQLALKNQHFHTTSMSLASRSLPSGPMPQSDIFCIGSVMNEMYPVWSVN